MEKGILIAVEDSPSLESILKSIKSIITEETNFKEIDFIRSNCNPRSIEPEIEKVCAVVLSNSLRFYKEGESILKKLEDKGIPYCIIEEQDLYDKLEEWKEKKIIDY